MPVPALIRDSFVGQLIYHASGRRVLRHKEELPGFEFTPSPSPSLSPSLSRTKDAVPGQLQSKHSRETVIAAEDSAHVPSKYDVEMGNFEQPKAEISEVEAEMRQAHLVDWEGPDDPDHPWNVRGHLRLALLCAQSVFTVVSHQEMVRHRRGLPSYHQYLRRLFSVRPRHRRYLGAVPCLAGRRNTWSRAIHCRLRHRAYVPQRPQRDSPARTDGCLHRHLAHIRRSSARHSPRE
jgi:hypothetical protein